MAAALRSGVRRHLLSGNRWLRTGAVSSSPTLRPAISPGACSRRPHSSSSFRPTIEAPGGGAYNSCTGGGSHGGVCRRFEEPCSPRSDFKLQNGTAPYCLYSRNRRPGTGTTAGPNCFAWVSNEWMRRFKLGITLGARDNVRAVRQRAAFASGGHARPAIAAVDRLEAGYQRIFPVRRLDCLPTNEV